MKDVKRKQWNSPVKQEMNLGGGCGMVRSIPEAFVPDNSREVRVEKPSLMLHSCCGLCCSAVLERLVGEFNITVYFYNPCITDEEEYKRRRESQLLLVNKMNEELAGPAARPGQTRISFMEGPYNPGAFFEICKGFEAVPEGGARCALCFRQRLERTAEAAGMSGCDWFGTTLTVSPHKDFQVISQIGKDIALKYGTTFLDRDFKKKDGFKRSIELSKKYGLYRQNYCGCRFSKK